MPAPADPPLEVAVNRRRIDRFWVPILIIDVVLLAGIAVVVAVLLRLLISADSSAGETFLALVGPLAGLSYVFFLLSSAQRTWRSLRRAGPVIVVDARGLALRTARGQVWSTWDAVAGVSRQHTYAGDRLVVRFVAPHDPRRQGVSATRLTRHEQRFLERNGLMYSLRILDVQPDLLFRSIHALSEGRVTPQVG